MSFSAAHTCGCLSFTELQIKQRWKPGKDHCATFITDTGNFFKREQEAVSEDQDALANHHVGFKDRLSELISALFLAFTLPEVYEDLVHLYIRTK